MRTRHEIDAAMIIARSRTQRRRSIAPASIVHRVSKKTSRPLCPHPQVAIYDGHGSPDDAASFECGANPVGADTEALDARVNQRLFGKPFVPSHE